ncbi:MAG: tyrosine--tRNA ligase [Hyphomicrobiaceae bacterium]|nr:MAG: tyrosine--tRNA ligase [Hyphomicrobiaceae bacterium]
MAKFTSDFLNVLDERGFIHQCSDFAGLDTLADRREIIAYVGYDCTAPSLHVGHLISIMMLHWLQQSGGKPIALMGGGTTRVGDPSGKDETRRILPIETIDANKEAIKGVFLRFLKFGSRRTDALMLDNAEWLAPLNYIDFLRDVGRHFSVNRMLTMDSAKLRLERDQELSFIEFNYMLLQAYDFVEQAKRYGCNLQMGGSDQWGNIVTGIDLGRRMGTHQLYALTCPLLTTSSGAKMGKTAAGAVWLNEQQLSAYDYWQFWRNTEDGDVGRFLKLFTTLPMDEIAKLEALEGAEINEAKKVLATEATALLHGREKAEAAAEAARKTFEQGVTAKDLPTVDMVWSAAEDNSEHGWEARSAEAILRASGLASSLSDARRKIAEGAVKINDEPISDSKRLFGKGQVDQGTGAFKVQYGKKKIVLLKPL